MYEKMRWNVLLVLGDELSEGEEEGQPPGKYRLEDLEKRWRLGRLDLEWQKNLTGRGRGRSGTRKRYWGCKSILGGRGR